MTTGRVQVWLVAQALATATAKRAKAAKQRSLVAAALWGKKTVSMSITVAWSRLSGLSARGGLTRAGLSMK